MAVTLFHKIVINEKIHNKVIIRNKKEPEPEIEKPKTTNYRANVITRSQYSRDVKKL